MSIFNLHSDVLADYRDYVRSFFTVADDRAREFIDRELVEQARLWPEALLQVSPSYARVASVEHNRRASELAAAAGKPGTAGSDAHAYLEVGRTTMRLPDFHDAQSLRAALSAGEVRGRLSPYWVHLLSRYAVWRKQAGWRPPP